MKSFLLRSSSLLITSALSLFAGVPSSSAEEPYKDAWYYREQVEKAKDRAEAAREKKDKEAERKAIGEEIDHLGAYVKQSPDDVDMLERYAVLLADNIRDAETFGSAFEALEKVVEKDPERTAARKKLVQFLVLGEIHRYNDAREHLDYLLKKTPNDSESLHLLGYCQLGMGKSEEAVASWQKAIESSPREVDAYWPLATTLRSRFAKPAEADAWMEKMIAANPKSAKAHRYMSRYLLAVKTDPLDPKAALKHAELALKLDPEFDESLALAADCCVANGNADAARRYAKAGLEKVKSNLAYRERMYLILSDADNLSKNRKAAIENLQKAYAERKNPDVLWLIADEQSTDLDISGAEATLAELTSLDYDAGGVAYLRGKIRLLQSKWREACEALESAKPFCLGKPERLCRLEFFLGSCYGELGDTDQQIAAFRRALEINPQFTGAQQALAEALKKAGKGEAALQEAARAAKSSKNPQALLTLIGLRIEKQRLAKGGQQWEEIEQLLDGAERDFPGIFQFSLMRCDTLIARGRIEEAENYLRKLTEKAPKNPFYWAALANFSIYQRQWSRAEETLKLFEKSAGDCVELRLTKAKYYSCRYGAKAGPYLGPLREGIERLDDGQKILLWIGLLKIALPRGDKIEADNLIRLLVEKDPNNLQVQLQRFDQANAAQDLPGMEKILGDIERIEGKGPFWLYGKACVLSRRSLARGDKALLDEALELLKQAKELRPSWPKIPLVAGEFHDRKGETGEALARYLEAIELGENNLVAIRRAVQLLHGQQRFKEADDLLDRLEGGGMPLSSANDRQPVLFLELAKWRVALLVEQGKFEQAAQRARKLVDFDSKDFQEPLWYGQVMWNIVQRLKAAGRAKESAVYAAAAEKSFRLAAKLGGKNPVPWGTLIHFLAFIGEMDRAEKALEEAKKLFGDREPLVLAECYEATKDLFQAGKQYEAALKARPNDPRAVRLAARYYYRTGDKKQAESLLSRILERGALKDGDPEAIESRRMLAALLAERGGSENAGRARDLLANNLSIDPHSAADNRMLANLDSRDPEHRRRREAIESLLKLQANRQASPEERYNLAKLYLADKDWKNARETFRKLTASMPDQMQYSAIFARELLDHGEIAEAEPLLRTLEEKWPNYMQTMLLKSELLLRRGKADEAVDLLKRFADSPSGVPADRGERLRLIALAMEDFATRLKLPENVVKQRLLPAAESYQRLYLDGHPTAALELVNYLARQGRFEEAAELLEKTWKTGNPLALAQACLKVAQDGRGPKKTVERIASILRQSRGHFQDDAVIALTLGNLYTGMGKYAEAEEYFHGVLEKKPRDAVAMNNLAALLAAARKDLDEALELIEKAMKITGPMPQMLDTRACVHIARGDGEKALADLAEALADAKTPERLFHQAQAYELAGQKHLAAKSMKEAIAKGLSEKTLSAVEVPIYERLKKAADELPPSKDDDGPSYIEDYAWLSRRQTII